MKDKYVINEDDLYNVIKLPSEYEKCNFIGKLIYLWKWKFFWKFYKKDIKLNQIPKGRKIDESHYIYDEFLKYWNAEMIRAKRNKRNPNLLYPIFHQYGFQIIFFGLFVFITFYAVLIQALYVEDLIKHFNAYNDGNKDSKRGIILVSLLITLCSFVTAICGSIFNNYLNLISIRVRACLSELVYRKAILLSKSGLDNTSAGQIVNFLSVDMGRIDWVFNMLPFPVVGCSLLIYAIYKLWKYLKYFTFYGVLFLLVVLPIQSGIGAIFSTMRMKAADYTDERIRLVDEFINAIKIIKFYCWELQFSKKIEEARKKEIDIMRRSLYIYSVSIGLFTSTTKMVVYIILIVFYFSGGLITDQVVFLTLSVFTQVTFLITVFIPHFILTSSNLWITLKRLNKFLSLEEREQLNGGSGSLFISTAKNSIKKNGDYVNGKLNTSTKKVYDLSIRNLTACYSSIEGLDNPNFFDEVDKSSEKSIKLFNVIKNINFDCKPGELIIVVGAVGSGKSSLLQTILSELRIAEGNIEVNGRLSYSSQEPWTFSGTVKENILFDSEYDEEKYNEIIKVCALERDLTLFQDGDDTFIGERGVALSGGQKARINLARSLYFDADIYLLDDPLSAVDAHVAKHIFKQAIKDFLKHKAVILVTHQLNYIKYADKVLFIKDGEQVFFDQGESAMKKLKDEPDSEFAKFIGSGVENQIRQYTSRKRQDSSRTNVSSSLLSIAQSLVSRKNSLSLDTLESIPYDEQLELDQNKEFNKIEKKKRLQEEEDDKVRFVYKAYLSYFKHGKISYFGPLVLFIFILSQTFASSSDYMLKMWSDSVKVSEFSNLTIQTTELPNEYDSIKKFIYENNVYCYSGLIGCFFLVSLIRTMIFSMFGMRASVNIHKHLFERIVRAKMKFFYNNSVGIILNRFSRDVGIVDNDLIGSFHDFLEILITSTIIFIIMLISNPFLIVPFLTFITCVIIFRNFYIHTARSLETLEGVAKSPVIQHLTSTLNGLTTVRAFKRENKFIKKFEVAQNDHTAVHFATHSSKRMFSYMLDNFQIFFVGGCFLVLTILAEFFSGSLIGLLTTYILQFSGEFQWCVICWSNVETYLCAVDRIERMGKNLGTSKQSLSEPALTSSPECKPPENWPKNAKIVFNDVTMRYFENESPVLKNLNFIIEEKQKIGIVGRTGAGKSSIVSALFRLTDYEGDIIIDGINCKSIGLHDLRGKISIIPQEPVLFTGTIRSNLDPLSKFKDDQLWDALKVTQLEQVVKELEGGLDSKVNDNGGNFSVGQKQLICLARAILKENKILVIDEATANCDPKTDELIQTTIRNVFKDCTILTIAHRLNTIMDSTKILVLDAGELKEFDKPLELLKNEDSLFRGMVYANGDEQANHLITIAKQNGL